MHYTLSLLCKLQTANPTYFFLSIVHRYQVRFCLSNKPTALSFILKGKITTSCDLVFLPLDKYQHAPHAQDVHVCWLCLSSVVVFLQWVLLLIDLCVLLDAKREVCIRKIKICIFFRYLISDQKIFPFSMTIQNKSTNHPPPSHTHLFLSISSWAWQMCRSCEVNTAVMCKELPLTQVFLWSGSVYCNTSAASALRASILLPGPALTSGCACRCSHKNETFLSIVSKKKERMPMTKK